jgi:predicted nucleic acid-binding protein
VIVISDTSPLNYLILIEEVSILAALYQRVLIPEMVFRELQHPRTPSPVREWTAQAPAWLEVHSVHASASRDLAVLDPGERLTADNVSYPCGNH